MTISSKLPYSAMINMDLPEHKAVLARVFDVTMNTDIHYLLQMADDAMSQRNPVVELRAFEETKALVATMPNAKTIRLTKVIMDLAEHDGFNIPIILMLYALYFKVSSNSFSEIIFDKDNGQIKLNMSSLVNKRMQSYTRKEIGLSTNTIGLHKIADIVSDRYDVKYLSEIISHPVLDRYEIAVKKVAERPESVHYQLQQPLETMTISDYMGVKIP
jgi:hypothetical protein